MYCPPDSVEIYYTKSELRYAIENTFKYKFSEIDDKQVNAFIDELMEELDTMAEGIFGE